jgi:hypothetical protein
MSKLIEEKDLVGIQKNTKARRSLDEGKVFQYKKV